MLRRRQLKVILAELAAIHNTRGSWQDMNGAVRRKRIILEPLVEKVSVLVETDGQVFKEFEGEGVHLVILPLEEGIDPLVLLLGREWSIFVERKCKCLIATKL